MGCWLGFRKRRSEVLEIRVETGRQRESSSCRVAHVCSMFATLACAEVKLDGALKTDQEETRRALEISAPVSLPQSLLTPPR